MRNFYKTSKNYISKMDTQAKCANVAGKVAYWLAILSTVDVGGLAFRCVQSFSFSF